MNYLPPRKFKPRSIPKARSRPRRTSAIKCRAHLTWLKTNFDCLVRNGSCFGPIDPHHVVSRGAGGGDETCVSLCRHHHDAVHHMGRAEFEKAYRVDLGETAAALWDVSPAGKIYRRSATQAPQVGTPPEAETLAAKSPNSEGDE